MTEHEHVLASLKEMQVYVGREMVEEFRSGRINRRTLFKRLLMICGGAAGASALLAACGDDDGAKALDAGGGDVARPDGAGPDAGAGDTGDAAVAEVRPGALSVPADDPAVSGSKVTFPNPNMSGGTLTAYLAKPAAAGSYPGVIVIHENRGLNDHIRDVARRLAKKGFIALAPDLTSRWGTTEKLDPDMARTALSMATPADLVADLSTSIEYLKAVAGVTPSTKVGVIGFCMGGGYTFRIAAVNPAVAVAVPYYGPAPAPIDMIKNTSAQILAHYAETDDNVNSTREMIEMAAKEAGKVFEKRIHPGTRHAFNNDTGANYHEAEAIAAWTETVAWLGKLRA